MKHVVVLGATGDVGRGVTEVLLESGHTVVAVSRTAANLAALAAAAGDPPRLRVVPGSLESERSAARMLRAVRAAVPQIDAVVVSVNAAREPGPLLARSATELASLIGADLVTHYTAARVMLPALAPGALYLGIGGGSCDFVLEGGVPQSMAQAGLRMMYRGLAHELAGRDLHLRELIIASVVNGRSTRERADPAWVTDREIGQQVDLLLADPGAHPGPILRLARRDASGRPVFSSEPASRVQGFR